jgi:hypothetical protein
MSPRFAKLMGYGEMLPDSYGVRFMIVLLITTAIWVTVTFLTPPSDEKHLMRFCKKVKPFPTFWGPIYRKYPDLGWNPYSRRSMLHFLFGSAAIFGICFGVGNMIFGAMALGVTMITASLLTFGVILTTWKVGA